jgi:hypothetical protein
MDHEIQLISDGDGIAVIGDATDVERFLASEELPSKDLGLRRLTSVAGAGAAVAQAGSEAVASSGRWVQLSPTSAQLVKKYGLRESGSTGLSTGVIKAPKGQVGGFVEFSKGSLLTNPALLAGAAGIMAQVAMQQSMAEITDYLAAIDEKVDDVLRAQKDAVLARMIGVGFVVDEAMTLREARGRVDEVTWSKVQGAPATIAETQAYALRQLDALAEKLERKTSIAELTAAAEKAASTVREWLAVLARSFQLQDEIAVLELDRVLDASPDELTGHRLGLRTARQHRLEHITRSTEQLVARMNAAAAEANANVLLNPFQSPAVVRASNQVAIGVHEFHERLGIDSGHRSSESRRWMDAAVQARDKALETGAQGVGVAKGFGSETLNRAGKLAGRARGWRRGDSGE